MKIWLLVLLTVLSINLHAQDDMMDLLNAETEDVSNDPVIATFKTTRIVNAHSVETVKAKTMDVRISHRFGNAGGASGGGIHQLYGLDNAANIRLAMEYGVTDKLTLGLGRSKVKEHIDSYLKYRLTKQTKDNKMPVSVTVFANTGITPMAASTDSTSENSYANFSHRLSYTYQAIIARKISEFISVEIVPTYLHRNYVAYGDENGLFSMGYAARIKFTRSSAFLVDYFYTLSNYRKNNYDKYFSPLGIAYELETGGHVFHISFTNAAGIIENDFIPNTTSDWLNGGYKLAFTISRVINMH
ncbi:MAG: hypothetical protein COC01_07300 [Bacteroidetes bacterium]|nr:MAG: hypothetical protein COC01_07300 [Bacteroidota bacterium]